VQREKIKYIRINTGARLTNIQFDTRFGASNPAKSDGFLRATKPAARLTSEGK
jgi:hypothetical protein